jgi:hypothetical protein
MKRGRLLTEAGQKADRKAEGIIMPIHVVWGDEARSVVVITFDGVWTWEDFRQMQAKLDEMSSVLIHARYDAIVDATNAAVPPIGALSKFGNAAREAPPELKLVIIAGVNVLIRALIEIVRKISPKAGNTWRLANNVDDAWKIIAQSRAKSRQES